MGENLLRITYNYIGVKITGTLQFCGGCAKSKEKPPSVRKNNYMIASQPGERIFVYTTGPFTESLISNLYLIGVVDYYSRYSLIFFTKIKSLLPKKMEDLFKIMTSFGTQVKYLCYNNTGEHQ